MSCARSGASAPGIRKVPRRLRAHTAWRDGREPSSFSASLARYGAAPRIPRVVRCPAGEGWFGDRDAVPQPGHTGGRPFRVLARADLHDARAVGHPERAPPGFPRVAARAGSRVGVGGVADGLPAGTFPADAEADPAVRSRRRPPIGAATTARTASTTTTDLAAAASPATGTAIDVLAARARAVRNGVGRARCRPDRAGPDRGRPDRGRERGRRMALDRWKSPPAGGGCLKRWERNLRPRTAARTAAQPPPAEPRPAARRAAAFRLRAQQLSSRPAALGRSPSGRVAARCGRPRRPTGCSAGRGRVSSPPRGAGPDRGCRS